MEPFVSTLQYERLHYRFVHKIFYSSSLVTPHYTIIHDKKDETSLANYGGLLTLTKSNYREKIHEIKEYLEKIGRKPALYVTPDATPGDLNDLIPPLGFSPSFTDAWMFFSGKAEITFPPNVSIRSVDSNNEMLKFVELFNRVYSGTDPSEPYGKAPEAWGENLIGSYNKTDPALSVKYFILQEDREDVAIVLSVSDGKRAGLYSVGTIPERRKRGLSTLVTLYAVSELQRQQVSEIYLLTEKDTYNERFYKKIGFETRWYATGWISQGV